VDEIGSNWLFKINNKKWDFDMRLKKEKYGNPLIFFPHRKA
jgi:hypothetical protein